MGIARRHHFVPALYLAGFTDGGERGSRLWALDVEERRWYPTTPHDAAARRDFYRVEVPGGAPDLVEQKILAPIEGEAKRVLDGITTSREIPEGRDFDVLMHFVALTALRVPARREAYTPPMVQVAHMMLSAALASPERWAARVAAMRADGVELGDDSSFEEMRAFFDSGDMKIDVANDFHVQSMLLNSFQLAALLKARAWVLAIPGVGAGDFVTSDDPVTINWSTPADRLPSGPGFGLRGTTVSFPLSRGAALFGVFRDGSNATMEVPKPFVALANTYQVLDADRRVYAPGTTFPCVGEAGVCDDPTSLPLNRP